MHRERQLEQEASSDNFSVLVRAGERLATSTDVAKTAQNVFDIFVPTLAASCVAWVDDLIIGDHAQLPEDRDNVGVELSGASPSLLIDELRRKSLRALELARLTETARHEVTRYRHLEQQLEERNQQLIDANRELESFAYSVSHDLRAPLRSIMSASMIVMEDYGDKLDADGIAELKRSSAAAKRMSLLIDDLLEYSRLGRREMNVQSVGLSSVAKAVGVESKIPDDVLAIDDLMPVQGDPTLLRVLLSNLIENSWKYSREKPSPKIEVGEMQLGSERVFFVRDNGIGFDEQYMDKLFVPFERLHNASDYPGTGIGLPNVKRIVNRHNGRVWANGKVGEGAIFYFTLNAV